MTSYTLVAVSVLGAVTLIISMLIWQLAKIKRNRLVHQLHSLTLNTSIKRLLSSTQQHRGMVNAFLSGDTSFKEKIPQPQKIINTTLNELHNFIQANAFTHHSAHLKQIQQSWQKLQPTVLALTKPESMQQHSAIIQSILYLMANVAEESQLYKDNCYPIELVGIFWHRLPNIAEAIGKTRGVGAGIAATGSCSAIEHIKIGFLIHSIKTTTATVEKAFSQIQGHNLTSNKLYPAYKQVQEEVLLLMDTVTQKLLDPSTPEIAANLFFDQATATLTNIYAFFDEGERMIGEELNSALTAINVTIKTAFITLWVTTLTIIGVALIY